MPLPPLPMRSHRRQDDLNAHHTVHMGIPVPVLLVRPHACCTWVGLFVPPSVPTVIDMIIFDTKGRENLPPIALRRTLSAPAAMRYAVRTTRYVSQGPGAEGGVPKAMQGNATTQVDAKVFTPAALHGSPPLHCHDKREWGGGREIARHTADPPTRISWRGARGECGA